MVGVYERWILPRLLDLSMRNRLLDHYRQRTIETARGLVLEVGVGSGLNLRFYSRTVDRVCGIDLSPELLRLAHTRTADTLVPVCCSELRRNISHSPSRPSIPS
jgi:SAM-dependent methyltransferase